ncbi:50S ribosomal protein L11 methyltransferase [Micromonosporaceae bacterium Da 78-11]
MTTWTVRNAPAAGSPFAFFPSMGEYPAYDDGVYDAFDAADDRSRGYAAAVRAAAPGKVVLDIGTGRDALWAIAAARADARHVYAIEAQATAASAAHQAVARAGLADRVTVIADTSTRVRLQQRAEVCVSEIVGNIASAEGAIAVLADARARLCTADCVWIPFRMQTWVAAVDLSRAGPPTVATESLPYLRAVFDAAGGPFDLRLCLAGPVAEVVISAARPVESVVFDSRRAVPPAEQRSEVELGVESPGARLTGLLLWARVAPAPAGREIDTLTGDTRGWAPVYVPVALPGVATVVGERIRVGFDRRTGDDGVHPDYAVTVGDHQVWSSPHRGGGFRRTPFYRDLFSSPGRPAAP